MIVNLKRNQRIVLGLHQKCWNANALQFLERIRIPTLLVQAKDDPLIPFEVYDHPAFSQNTWLRLVAVEHGGHLGFVAKGKPRFWLDQVLVQWIGEVRNKTAAHLVIS